MNTTSIEDLMLLKQQEQEYEQKPRAQIQALHPDPMYVNDIPPVSEYEGDVFSTPGAYGNEYDHAHTRMAEPKNNTCMDIFKHIMNCPVCKVKYIDGRRDERYVCIAVMIVLLILLIISIRIISRANAATAASSQISSSMW